MGFFGGLFAGSYSVSNEGHWLTHAVAPLTHAGTAVSEQTALRLTAVYSAIRIISESVSQLPVDILRRDGDRNLNQRKHPLRPLFNKQPNPWMSAVNMRCTLQAHALGWGNGYAEIQRNQAGDPIGLWPLLPDRTRPVCEQAGETLDFYYETTINGRQFRLAPGNVLHVLGLSFDGLTGYSPLWMARQAAGLGLALEEFGAKFFGNDSKSGGFLKHPGRLSKQAQKNLEESMDEQGGLDNAHRMKVLEEGMEYQPITIAPEDAQFLKTREFQVEEIARLYGVPLFMLQSHSKDTSWGTGISEQSLGFLRYTVNPWLTRWEQEGDRKLFDERERELDYYMAHDPSSMLRSDAKGRAEFYTKALNPQTGWMERDEVRRWEDLNPLNGQWQQAPAPQPATPNEG